MQFRLLFLLRIKELVGLAYVQNLGLLMKRTPDVPTYNPEVTSDVPEYTPEMTSDVPTYIPEVTSTYSLDWTSGLGCSKLLFSLTTG